jgi:hypothetical protein
MTPQERKNFESIRDNVHGEKTAEMKTAKTAQEAIQLFPEVAYWYNEFLKHNTTSSQPEQTQKQEPVGRFSKFTDGVWREVTATSAGQFLYASPPQRQPLTDEQIFEVHKRVDSMQYLTFAKAIEAAHGITGEKE